MPLWIHRTTKRVLESVPSADLPESIANYIEEPDLSAVTGQPPKYWLITGDVVTLMDAAAQAVVDAAILIIRRDGLVDKDIDKVESITRAFMLVVIDEFNLHSDKINALLDAIDNATSLATLKATVGTIANHPTRTTTQLRTAIRNKLGT